MAYPRRFTLKKCPKGLCGILKQSMPLGVDPVLDQHLKRILSPDHPPVSVKLVLLSTPLRNEGEPYYKHIVDCKLCKHGFPLSSAPSVYLRGTWHTQRNGV